MKKYIVLYHAPASFSKMMQSSSPEEMKEHMGAWMAWAEKCGSHLVDMGTPLGGGMKISPTGSEPSGKDVVGYSILQAESMESAIELLRDHPHLMADDSCAIEVHESLPVPGS